MLQQARTWRIANATWVGRFSAVCYLTARDLRDMQVCVHAPVCSCASTSVSVSARARACICGQAACFHPSNSSLRCRARSAWSGSSRLIWVARRYRRGRSLLRHVRPHTAAARRTTVAARGLPGVEPACVAGGLRHVDAGLCDRARWPSTIQHETCNVRHGSRQLCGMQRCDVQAARARTTRLTSST